MFVLRHLTVIFSLAIVLSSSPARAGVPRGTAAWDLLWQAKQYTEIKTIHLRASASVTETTVNGRMTAKISYEYWGDGSKYRVMFRQSMPQANYDRVIADDGKHLYALDRITGHLVVRDSQPTGGYSLMENPILEPLAPLAPPQQHHPVIWNLWVNLPRFAHDPKSIFDRCRAVRDCRDNEDTTGNFSGCILGSYAMLPAHVKFIFQKGPWPHPLVTSWTALMSEHGMHARLRHMSYRVFRLPSGRKIFLPIAFEVDGASHGGYFRGPSVARTKVTQIMLDKPIPPGIFRISYKLANFVTVEKDHRYTTIQVKPTGQPQGWSK